jgi:hypothetical protein
MNYKNNSIPTDLPEEVTISKKTLEYLVSANDNIKLRKTFIYKFHNGRDETWITLHKLDGETIPIWYGKGFWDKEPTEHYDYDTRGSAEHLVEYLRGYALKKGIINEEILKEIETEFSEN